MLSGHTGEDRNDVVNAQVLEYNAKREIQLEHDRWWRQLQKGKYQGQVIWRRSLEMDDLIGDAVYDLRNIAEIEKMQNLQTPQFFRRVGQAPHAQNCK